MFDHQAIPHAPRGCKGHSVNHFMRHPLALLLVCALGGCTMHIDKPVQVAQGDLARSIYVVDGAISLDAQARARKLSTVDGSITLGRWAHATALRSVDGDITMGAGASCSGDVSSVDSTIRLDDNAKVDGNVSTIAGHIQAHDALITGRLETVSGRIRLSGATHLDQGIVLALPSPKLDDATQKALPVVVIGAGAVVAGPIVAHRGGTLWVSREARIGAVQGIAVQWFDGAAPPHS